MSTVALLLAIMVIVILVISLRPRKTIEGCRTKRVRITHICDLRDKDDNDGTLEIRVLIDDQLYWPLDTSTDCNSSRGESCVIQDTSLLTGCYPLKNNVAYRFDEPPTESSLEVTVVEVDTYFNDDLSIFVPNMEWFDPEECEEQTILANSFAGASLKMEITSEVTTTRECGIDLGTIVPGLSIASNETNAMAQVLADYSNIDVSNNRQKLYWAGLAKGVLQFAGKLVTGASKGDSTLSTIANVLTVGSTLFSFAGYFGGDESDPRQEELFKQVFERFDQIDQQLDDIESQMTEGIEEIKITIQEEFANAFIDEWINEHLAALDNAYRAFLNPDHTIETRRIWEDAFRNSCLNDHPPYETFSAIYGHTCRECNKLGGRRSQHILDTFVDIAVAEFKDVPDRVRWFCRNFVVVMVGAAFRAIILHAVCLYQPETVCQNEDPVWSGRLEEMRGALVEMANSLSEAEDLLYCHAKTVQITEICNLPDLEIDINHPNENGGMDIKLEIGDDLYWPIDLEKDCVDGLGSYGEACVIPKDNLLNTCYVLENSIAFKVSDPPTLQITIRDVDFISWADETVRFDLTDSGWYNIKECREVELLPMPTNGDTYIKIQIKSDVLHESWGT